jgi:plastocyanin
MSSGRALLRLFPYLVVTAAIATVSVIASAGFPAFRTIKIKRGNHPIKIDSNISEGARPHGVLVSAGDTITWCRDDGGKFSVDFKDKSPFTDHKKHFDDKDCNSPDVIDQASTTNDNDVYKYSVTADGKPPFDPHVIVAGGGPTEPSVPK